MRSLLACPLLALVVGCATAVAPGAGDDVILVTDARTTDGRTIDARPTDAAIPVDAPGLTTITLSQTGAVNIVSANSVSCNAAGVTNENSYYRVFRLADFGVNRPFTPTSVSFGVEQATSGTGSGQTVQVRLYTLNGALSLANLTNVAGNNVVVPDTTNTVTNVTIAPAPVIQPTATVVAEVFVPDATALGHQFFVGTNNGSETAPGYLRGPACGVAQPTTYTALGFPTIRLVLSVTGTY